MWNNFSVGTEELINYLQVNIDTVDIARFIFRGQSEVIQEIRRLGWISWWLIIHEMVGEEEEDYYIGHRDDNIYN